MVKVYLNKEWKAVSKKLSIEKQIDFLADVLTLESTNPKQHKWLYVGAIALNLIFNWGERNRYIIIMIIISMMLIELYQYMRRLKAFRKKWKC